jgi:hypothetical protein
VQQIRAALKQNANPGCDNIYENRLSISVVTVVIVSRLSAFFVPDLID